ncbi:unnamed protein product [Protopolystoma xenopodis]|uniref:Nitric oxide synthase-interacting protein zinc-finger domain-containing protein n=1 Tax=Protopolystoma xenopodis TaxID=117903 RepID=A0A448X3X2_9PLAT|nr:unnamed protein product [Protopolystoma xenopodis]
MTRHSKNCTAHTVYTYHERKRDAEKSGYGTTKVRLGKDSVRGFNCCCLTLQPAKDPVVTPDGYLYDRASILEYILNRKADIQRNLKNFEKQLARDAKDKEDDERLKEEEAKKFLAFNTLETHAKAAAQENENEALACSSRTAVAVEGAYKPGKAASFWHPTSSKPLKGAHKLPPVKPDTVVRCPMSQKPIKYKDLIPVNFKCVVEDDEAFNLKKIKSASASERRFCCAVSNDLLTNSSSCVVLRTSSSVVTQEVVDSILRKDMYDPINGKPLKEDDFIHLQRGSLGYADERVILTAKRSLPVMQT